MQDFFDILVIGGGPGGYVAALRAAQLGMKVGLVERAELGGVCLNWGCIPTKTLLRSGSLYRQLFALEEFGISVEKPDFDLAKIVARSRGVANRMENGIKGLLRKGKIEVFDGEAKLLGRKAELQHVSVIKNADKETIEIKASHVVLATGARARYLSGLEPDGKLIWGAREAMTPKSFPKQLLVAGAGAIGIEFASFYRDLGADVTIIEALDQILPNEDEEVVKVLQRELEKRGIKIQTGTRIESVEKHEDSLTVKALANGKPVALEADRLIMAIGVQGNIENIGLENTSVQTDRSFVQVDEFGCTNEPGIYAIGDLSGPPCLAHKASREAVITVEKIAGRMPQILEKTNIPGCIYSTPQVASIGLTEKAAKEAGYHLNVGRFPFLANGKAVAMGETEGMVKVIYDEATGELLGAHMIGAEVTEMIQGFCLMKTGELTEAEASSTVFPHPTMSEAMLEATLGSMGEALHI
ncbi:dihydrolipoyl dehydrogenase [Acetobacteraceae bacterium]|nr:dihydrolipoyl dehydrogenase [Acetobacteraceae bacterium]